MSSRRAPTPATTGGVPPSALRPPRPRGSDVFIRLVCAENLMPELATIRALLPQYPYVTVYAEHAAGGGGYADADGRVALPPGVRVEGLPAAARYALAKIDVDAFPLLRLGITLCDAHGRLPSLRAVPWAAAAAASVWQVELLPSRGSSSSSGGGGGGAATLRELAYALRATGVVSPETWGNVTWVAHGGLYHLGFLLKALTGGAPLPDTRGEFLAALRGYLGGRVFDVRYVAARVPKGVTLKGPLAYLAALLGAPAAAARGPWQAGEKSLAACQVFMRIKGLYFAWDGINMHAGCIDGLHAPPPWS
ncbi:hypothetical protein PAHAL_8G040900 [Panicum hallii]|uniref:Uncharacterized protein n=1 Tax=Panicum hallii TaxID=206008 RepID=A0A2S3ICN0_9POAL|nr:probable CCR4-associated factor 1 homolog 9 [Panicum hallii]PAN41400.1 hypothetical protein PAHAL_8G040900 [Panicum hallii]